jgi:hypothetical protein
MSSYKMTHKHLDELLATRPTCTIDHVVFYTGESKDTLKLQFDDAWMRDWPGRVDQLPRLHVYIDGEYLATNLRGCI